MSQDRDEVDTILSIECFAHGEICADNKALNCIPAIKMFD